MPQVRSELPLDAMGPTMTLPSKNFCQSSAVTGAGGGLRRDTSLGIDMVGQGLAGL
jgi:hypothetical protein